MPGVVVAALLPRLPLRGYRKVALLKVGESPEPGPIAS